MSAPAPEPVDESSPTLARAFPLEDPVSATDIVGACAGYACAMLGLGGVPELLHLTPGNVAEICGAIMLTAGFVRHFFRLHAAKRGV
jgi:hypothetical protein